MDRVVTVAPGVQVRVRVTGRENGPALVLLHGLGEDMSTWDAVQEPFGRHFTVVAMDLRGHGSSSRPGSYSFELMRDDVIGVLAALDLESVTLLGHSMGGVVAYLVAQARLWRVRGLIVEDVAPPAAWVRPIPERPDEDVPFDWAVVPAIVGELDDPGRRWWPGLSSIDVPTLLIGGGDASHIDQARLREVATLIPECTLQTIPAGHDVHETEPARFADAVLAWTASLR